MQTKEVPRVEAHSNRLGVLSAPPDASITNPARSGQNSLLSGKWPVCGSNVHCWGTGGFVLVNAVHGPWGRIAACQPPRRQGGVPTGSSEQALRGSLREAPGCLYLSEGSGVLALNRRLRHAGQVQVRRSACL